MSYSVFLPDDGLRDDSTVVFVTPHNQINAVVEHSLWNRLLRTVVYA